MICIVFFSIFMTGCSNEANSSGNKIIVQKRVGEEDQYELFKEITDNDVVKKAAELLEDVRWKNGVVLMTQPPHYKSQFEGDDQSIGSNYDLWISPNKDQVELVIEEQEKYIQLNKNQSAELFEFVTESQLINSNE